MQLMDIQAVAEMLAISRRKAEQMLACNALPKPMRFGRLRRWHPQTINDWLSAQAGLSNLHDLRSAFEPDQSFRGRPRNHD
jgi:excisionase family DNA binding protein